MREERGNWRCRQGQAASGPEQKPGTGSPTGPLSSPNTPSWAGGKGVWQLALKICRDQRLAGGPPEGWSSYKSLTPQACGWRIGHRCWGPNRDPEQMEGGQSHSQYPRQCHPAGVQQSRWNLSGRGEERWTAKNAITISRWPTIHRRVNSYDLTLEVIWLNLQGSGRRYLWNELLIGFKDWGPVCV